MTTRRRILAAAVCSAALSFFTASAATADTHTLDDLRALGYTVALASDLGGGCTVWNVSGYGMTNYVNDCDPQGAIDSWANPDVFFERKWQYEHPEQVSAAQQIGARCYSISRTATGVDSWHIVGGSSDVTAAGAELPGLAASLPDLKQPDGSCTVAPIVVTVPGSDASGAVTVPGSPEVVAAIDAKKTGEPAATTPETPTAAAATPEQIVVENAAPATKTAAGIVVEETPDGYAPAGVIYS